MVCRVCMCVLPGSAGLQARTFRYTTARRPQREKKKKEKGKRTDGRLEKDLKLNYPGQKLSAITKAKHYYTCFLQGNLINKLSLSESCARSEIQSSSLVFCVPHPTQRTRLRGTKGKAV